MSQEDRINALFYHQGIPHLQIGDNLSPLIRPPSIHGRDVHFASAARASPSNASNPLAAELLPKRFCTKSCGRKLENPTWFGWRRFLGDLFPEKDRVWLVGWLVGCIKFSVGPSVGNAHCFDCVLKADSRALMLSHTVVTCWSLMGQLNLYTPPQLLQVVASAGDKLFHLLNTRGL